jgi:hypothetical protein
VRRTAGALASGRSLGAYAGDGFSPEADVGFRPRSGTCWISFELVSGKLNSLKSCIGWLQHGSIASPGQGADAVQVFLSYHSPDREVAVALKTAIEAALPNYDIFLDQSHLRHGHNWQPALYAAIENSSAFITLIGNRLGNWQTAEYYAAHDKKVAQADAFVLLPVIIADRRTGPVPNLPGLSQLHWIECSEPAAPEVLQQIFRALLGEEIPEPPQAWMLVNPYRGLMALEEQDSDFFFGREAETEQAVNAIAREHDRIIALVGNSGVGKSSLVQAGVIASLKRGRFASGELLPESLRDAREWAYLTFRPADAPVRNLATAFVNLWYPGSTDTEKYKKIVEWTDYLSDNGTLAELLDATRERFREQGLVPPKRAFVYVDQGEEMYSRGGDTTSRLSKLLRDAAVSPDFVLMLSQRSDYYGNFQANHDLFTCASIIDVTQLTRDQLVRVLREPATRLGVSFYPSELPEQLVEAAGGQPGALALLADIMIEVWDRMQHRGTDGVIRPLEDAQILDIEKPLARRADRFMAEHPEERPVIERLFALRLIKILEQGNPFRRRVYEKDCSKAEWAVLNAMSASQWRLVVTGSEHDVAFAEVAHDILLSKWPALKLLIARERQFLLWRTDTEREFNRWLENWLDPAAIPADENARRAFNISVFERPEIAIGNRELLHGSRLESAVDTLANRSDDIDPHLRMFVARSEVVAREVEEEVHGTWVAADGQKEHDDIRLRVYLSYSRRDVKAADALDTALREKGIEVLLDRQDIAAGEEWQSRLISLIESVEAVVFVTSPDSITSETCAWELRHAERLGKKIVPFVIRPVAHSQLPPVIASLSAVVLAEPGLANELRDATRKLERVLKSNVAWLREGTRFAAYAAEWASAGSPRDRLLRGSAVVAARQWVQLRPSNAPEVPASVRSFIQSSEEAEKLQLELDAERRKEFEADISTRLRRQRVISWTVATGFILATALAIIGWWNRIGGLWPQ